MAVPDQRPTPGCPLPADLRAVLEDRLGAAGLDVFGPRLEPAEGVLTTATPSFETPERFSGPGVVNMRERACCPLPSRRT